MSSPEPSRLSELNRRAFSGAVALSLRHLVVSVVTVAGGVLLARMLQPEDFGYYAAAMLAVTVSVTLGEGGIGFSLIRQAPEPSEQDLRLAFSFQLAVTALFVILASIAVVLGGPLFGMSSSGQTVVLLALVAPLAIAFRTVPTVRLERSLRFGPLGAASVAEVVAFNAVAVTLAAAGFGAGALGIAVAIAAVVGTACLLVASRWRPRWGLDWLRLRHHLAIGLPFQGATFVSVAKDSINPVMIGLVAGAAQVGLVEWAQRFAAFALLLLFAMQKLLVAWFSRLQDQQEELDRAIRIALIACYTAVAPVALGSLVFAEPIVINVFGRQWLPALPVFWLLWAANLFVPAAAVAMAIINATGRTRVSFRFALLWMTTTWALGLPLILWLGFIGFGVANLLVQLTNFWLFRVAARQASFPWARTALIPWLLAAVSTIIGVVTYEVLPREGATRLLITLGALVVSYAGLTICRRDIREFIVVAVRGRSL